MEINRVINSSLNFTHSQINPATTHNHFYEKSTIEGKACSTGSCKTCCISDFFKKVGNLIAFPFVKIYEWITGLCRKERVEDPKSKKPLPERPSAPPASPEIPIYEDPEYLEPDRFTKSFFYDCGKRGIQTYDQLYQEIGDEPGKHAAAHALGWGQEMVHAWNLGIAYYLGKTEQDLPVHWHGIQEYLNSYQEGKEVAELLDT